MRSCRRRQPGMIRLSGSDGNYRVRTACQCFPDQEFELSQLVTAATKAVQILSLDENIHATKVVTQTGKILNGSWPLKERTTREFRKIELEC
ncbi:hypothetical protein WL05_00440 [Burkholderia ubonensis]|uniref:Uncharacterized protein n=1 Tax=Burkholderia ubonensis TaxID=101571 RepID=A0ABD4DUH8_9BURK|nr:hypothetical protein WJ51_19025 [Burkholderia ubonensis]KVM12907.1 hypothetical protein WJ52_18685 [Burkholderia ubonensis]KVM49936.1 hypothetical protein WJ56_15260 [Burkholderia ubonensis]KVN76752.1 hypothetical protein WJ68_25200 [Burkholderia ubonensis]KVO06683.1 hypothetical protein WJ71_08090 [Burkholderia ubonensis]